MPYKRSRGNARGASAVVRTSDGGSSSHGAPPSGGPSAAAAACRKKKTALSPFAVEYLKAWIMSPDHVSHPYPTEAEKAKIMKETHIDAKQLRNWFVNNRKRYWRPKVEELRGQGSARVKTRRAPAAPARRSPSPTLVATVLTSSGDEANCGANDTDASIGKANAVSSEDEESLRCRPPTKKRGAPIKKRGAPIKKRGAAALGVSSRAPPSLKRHKKFAVATHKVASAHAPSPRPSAREDRNISVTARTGAVSRSLVDGIAGRHVAGSTGTQINSAAAEARAAAAADMGSSCDHAMPQGCLLANSTGAQVRS